MMVVHGMPVSVVEQAKFPSQRWAVYQHIHHHASFGSLPVSVEAAEILLPTTLPLEAKAARQLADLAAVHHPHGGRVCRACATPDFHPGDSGVAIGSVLETEGLVLPAAVGVDINCASAALRTG